MIDGKLYDNEGRWCAGCDQFHGPLFNCKKYPIDIQQHLTKAVDKYINNLRSRTWCKTQIERTGMKQEALMMFRAMANIDENDWIE